jgi:hypothetical protein
LERHVVVCHANVATDVDDDQMAYGLPNEPPTERGSGAVRQTDTGSTAQN